MQTTLVSAVLPDVAQDAAVHGRCLDWVGMEAIALPILLADDAASPVATNTLAGMQVPASVDIAVNLVDPDARGIHMSRLYLQLQQSLAGQPLGVAELQALLAACIDSQRGLSSRARVRLRYDHLLLRRALASANAGWKRYPVQLEAEFGEAGLRVALAFSVDYSSTCPASAALSRQANAQRFDADFPGVQAVAAEAVHAWLASERGLAATPHAQRSRAEVRIELKPGADLPLLATLVDALESALGTPVQTAVKREDEQAFAELNAANLMFCEDAARRVAAVLAADARVSAWQARVAHFESLHPHDAVASVNGRNG